MAGEVRPRPGPAPSHSTPSLTAPVCHRPAQRTTEVPANSRHHGPRAVPSVSSVLILPPGPIADRHRRPQDRLQAARRSPAYPNTSPDNRACNSLTPFRCPHAVHLYESVDSGLGTTVVAVEVPVLHIGTDPAPSPASLHPGPGRLPFSRHLHLGGRAECSPDQDAFLLKPSKADRVTPARCLSLIPASRRRPTKGTY